MAREWKSISDEMARHEAVFVVGLARSGTSVLRNTLHQLPAFRGLRPKSTETHAFDRAELIPSTRNHRQARPFYVYMLKNDAQVDRMLACLEGLKPAFPRVREALARRTSNRSLAWRLRSHHHRVRLFFHFALGARESPRVLEKTPKHVHLLEEIFATFPRARVLLCIRHPVDAYSSVRKRLKRDTDRGDPEPRLEWLRETPEEYAARYRRVVRAEREQRQRRPSQTLLMRYEDLTGDPEGFLRRACEFVGEPFDRSLLLERADEERDAAGSPVQGSRLAANEKRWRDWVSEEEARRIEDGIGDDLAHFGYERYTDSHA